MADSFLSRTQTPAPTSSFVQQPPAGNPYQQQQQPFGGGGGGGFDPRYQQASATMIYQELGYRDGNPTEIEIFSDIIRSASPVARFLATEQGLNVLAQFLSTMLDYKLSSFFKDFKLSIVQEESGAMHIAPAVEQVSEKGKLLMTTTMAEVTTDMAMISQTLQSTLLQAADRTLASHREAAKLSASQGAMASLFDEATGQNKGPGVLSTMANFGLRTMGVPVGPAQPPAGTMPNPPPGR
jgi:hypothetical protein